MDTPALIRKKRDGGSLTRDEIFEFVDLYTSGRIPDYQCAAWLMAIYFRGLDPLETADLTEAMMHSGDVVDLKHLARPRVGKHSTGGVGDKVSLVIAPAAAAGGLYVPMISGRGLGHTGGTLDKLESIPGFNTRLDVAGFVRVVEATGLALIGQTERMAPADRKLYALRDVTATVESIALISASIMSKKLIEGTDALVLDVKTGSGAFMKKLEESRELARRMVEIGTACGKRVQALITDMNQPLGRAVGNSLEIIESIETLKGRGPADLVEVSREITAHMFLLGGIERGIESARHRFDLVMADGLALERFRQAIAAQGGDPRVIDDYALLPTARHEDSFVAPQDGFVAALEAEAMGRASMVLGAGRERMDSVIDPAVGLVFEKKVGDPVRAGERICAVYSNDRTHLQQALEMICAATLIAPEPVKPHPLIYSM